MEPEVSGLSDSRGCTLSSRLDQARGFMLGSHVLLLLSLRPDRHELALVLWKWLGLDCPSSYIQRCERTQYGQVREVLQHDKIERRSV